MSEQDKSQAQSGGNQQKAPGKQSQGSRQSGKQPGTGPKEGEGESPGDERGIGSSQGQDNATRDKDAAEHSGTADIERGSAHDTGRSQDSMVDDPTGAFKERP